MMPDGITPEEWFPGSIIVNPWSGSVLNAVGLSGPDAPDLLGRGIWQRISGMPWNLSFMSVQQTTSDRMEELREFVQLLLPVIRQFNAPVGLELNFSCPNANVYSSKLIQEVGEALYTASPLRIPLQCKFNALAPIAAVREISSLAPCGAIVMGNTIPWGQLPDQIPWTKLFNSADSPLKQFGGGGLSGPLLRKIHCEWIREARASGLEKPIWGCWGIDSASAVRDYHRAGASGIQFGTVCITRPWRTAKIIRRAYELFSH